ncbi:hypothetical protein [Pedobacter sp. Hv1]|uniref:hypothetical protein n=1 Tax=Pedobacter sp. Hv1 TaxID=1740090 RepID=UPI0006D8B0D6|nr:hypothetical protein [Pedobacter sp. Hv1]KQC00876.1 hypothetical protein AQF98_09375 [Pedobacter sp. Hv1]
MKKQLVILFILLTVGQLANAQKEYKLAKATGWLKLNVNNVVVEGYDGKDIVFMTTKTETGQVDERAKGLVAVSSSGYTDNTGLGISVVENGPDINVNMVSKSSIGILTIKVPQQIKVSFVNNNNNLFYTYTNNNSTSTNEIVLKNLKGEIEVSTNSQKIKLENNTGPMNIKTVNGAIEGIFGGDIKGPISIISVYGYVDITLATNTKANLELGSSYGKVYVDKAFNIDFEKKETEKKEATITNDKSTTLTGVGSSSSNKDVSTSITLSGNTSVNKDKVQHGIDATTLLTDNFGTFSSSSVNFSSSGEKIKGKLNGGGIVLILKSTNKSIYLRQQ